MKINRIVLLLGILCCGIVLISCTKENNTALQEEKGEITQKISEAKIVHKNVTVNGFDLKVPQFSNMEKGKQEKLNEILINQIKQGIEILDSKGSFAYFDYSIEYQDATKISVLFQYDYNKNNMPHPLVSAFAVNIDIANEKVITLSDVIEDKKDIVELFRKGKLKNVVKNSHGIEDDGGYLESQSDESILSDMGDHSFYIMDKGYGFVFNTIYASGNYMIYECGKWDNKNSLQTKDEKRRKS